MSSIRNICLTCLKKSNNLVLIRSQNTNGTSIEDKLKYFLPGLDLSSDIPMYICVKCEETLNNFYGFIQKCSQNIAIFEKYAHQVTEKSESHLDEVEMTDGNNYTSYPELKTEINDKTSPECLQDMVVGKYAEPITEKSGSSCPGEVEIPDEKNYHSEFQIETKVEIDDNKEFFIKVEDNKGSILNEEFVPLLHDIKQENSDDTCGQNGNISIENVDILEYPVISSIKNENISEEDGKCENCDEKFSYNEALKQQVSNKKGSSSHVENCQVNTCEICSKSFPSLYSLKQHKLVHTGEKPHTCEVCNKSFSRLYSLKEHKLLHTGEKPHTCEVCRKSFRSLRNLYKHKFVHTGEKPHTCEFCNQSFRQINHLKTHRLTHIDGEKYECKICKQSFKKLDTFQRHRLTHTDKKLYTCDICNKTFPLSYSLKEHKLTHTGGKPYTCGTCNQSFKLMKYLKRHQLLHTS